MQSTRTCSIDGCEKPVRCRSLCSVHYRRMLRHGDPEYVVPRPQYGLTCSVDGCEKDADTRGLCSAHYTRLLRYGEVGTAEPLRGGDMAPRFWRHVDKGAPGGCWQWTAGGNQLGYGQFRTPDGMKVAHRVAWELLRGSIPDGMELDHRCHNRGCVNPDHLRVVSRVENMQNHSGLYANNKSGHNGVVKVHNSWIAYAQVRGKRVHIGSFLTFEEAAKASDDYRAAHYSIDRI